jgi:hypothetical protein
MQKINGTKPDIIMYDELDILVMQFGKEAVLKMFRNAMPKPMKPFIANAAMINYTPTQEELDNIYNPFYMQ